MSTSNENFFDDTEIIFDVGVTKKFGFSSAVKKSIETNSTKGVAPWLVITSGAEGALAAYDSELVIHKIGALTGLMSGATGGGRVTHFPYRQITGIEYNAGFMNGVLEILTASYSGDTNRDFWNISKSNKGTSDPRQQNNTLPLLKITYNQIKPQIGQIRELLEQNHHGASKPPKISETSVADELEKLSELFNKGILSEKEFAAAKKKLLK